MNTASLKAWPSQVSTIIGALVGTPTFAALLMHQMTWEQAAPLLIGALVGLIYPENKALVTSAQTTTTDLEATIPLLLTAYRTGLTHGSAAVAIAPTTVAAPAASNPTPGTQAAA